MATRPPTERLEKWDRKFNTTRIKEVLDGEKPTMKTRAGNRFVELAAIEDSTKVVLNQQGISVAQTANYLCFARQVWKADKTYEGETLAKEVAGVLMRWKDRGLSQAVLEAIRDTVFTIGPPVPAP
ncbi:hypothetical protein FJY71_08050 [candidate division WOR-3 bacterium]|nr:hypothetical protein [candidate division WOR-3 bacterium]